VVAVLHELTFADVLAENRRSWPQRDAVVDGPTRLRYPDLDERTTRLAQGLRQRGVGTGDRILWLGQNSFRILEAVFAAAKLGAIFCPANWRQSEDELRYMLSDLGPAVVLYEPAFIAESLKDAHPHIQWLSCDGDGPDNYESLVASSPAASVDVEVDPASPLLAMYTAAFDGHPKAALLSHAGVIAHNMAFAIARQMRPGFVYLNSGPLFHVGTMFACLATAHLGGKNVFIAKFDAAEVSRLIEAEQCNSMLLLPAIIDQLVEANRDGRHDLSSLESPLGPIEWNAMTTLDTSPWGQSMGGYGQTEVGGMLSYAGFAVGAIGTHGRPSPLVQVRIVDPSGDEVPDGEVGEIVARGLHVMVGYFGNEDETRLRQAGGWHHTGDLGRREADGSLSFVGPRLHLIKSSAENIYPAEVERCLATHPSVADCAVIGIPDPQWAQSVRAIVVTKTGMSVSAEELIEHCRGRIASYKKPRSVVFADAIPKRGFAPDYDALDVAYGGGGYPGSTPIF
jgi:acyl-CoA synthetase (AMP-forming)/AMP-acid ligase II